MGYCLVSALHADESSADGMFKLQIVVDKHNGRLGVVDEMGVFGIRQEGDGSWLSFFNFGEGADSGFVAAFYASADQFGNLFGCKLHKLFYVFISGC